LGRGASGKPPGTKGRTHQFIRHSTPACEIRSSHRSPKINHLLSLFGIVPMAVGLFLAQPGGSVSRLVTQDEEILRVPVQPRPALPRFNWKEHKGPSCIPVRSIRRALISGPEQVDFILGNGARVRAKFDEDCPALDFYGNFYLEPQGGLLCVERDAIHSRIGGSCPIKRFRLLEPRLP
jgi:hypothetical protein